MIFLYSQLHRYCIPQGMTVPQIKIYDETLPSDGRIHRDKILFPILQHPRSVENSLLPHINRYSRIPHIQYKNIWTRKKPGSCPRV